jgi:hypothetical protein
LERSQSTQPGNKVASHPKPLPERLENDPRWRMVLSVVGSRHFARSPLLSRFLLYVAAETLEGRKNQITEHRIGVQVFGRPATYRTVEDNIVRNYARQLRKRLAEYFAADGWAGGIRIEIPLGGYVPVFAGLENADVIEESESGQALINTLGSSAQHVGVQHGPWRRHLVTAAALAVYSTALVCVTWFVVSRATIRPHVSEPAELLWQVILGGSNNTYIVPPDEGLNLLEDLSHHRLPLAEYMKGGYLDLPLPKLDSHSLADLRTQQFTSFVNLQIVASLSRLPQYSPERVFLRFPRDLRFDDLKNANVVIIGSACSNPWAAIEDLSTNFRIECEEGMRGATIVNSRPLPGEEASYASHWNEPTHVTFAVITFLPNLSGNGHLLFLQGLDVAGTQSAADAILHSDSIAPILEQAKRPDGTLRFFEILLRSTSIQSNATDTLVIASRIR